jgi:hypothetical protein
MRSLSTVDVWLEGLSDQKAWLTPAEVLAAIPWPIRLMDPR